MNSPGRIYIFSECYPLNGTDELQGDEDIIEADLEPVAPRYWRELTQHSAIEILQFTLYTIQNVYRSKQMNTNSNIHKALAVT